MPIIEQPKSAHASLREAAAEWIVKLSADDPQERETTRLGYEAWKDADLSHARVAQEMERLLFHTRDLVSTVPHQDNSGKSHFTKAARATLSAVLEQPARSVRHAGARSDRISRKGLGVLSIGAAFMLGMLLFIPQGGVKDLFADVRTDKGEQRAQQLPDGSRVVLSSASAINYKQDAGQRHVELLKGAIWVDVSKDPSRPFIVETENGRIQALGTRFIVQQEEHSTLLTMIESRVVVRAIQSPNAQDRIVVGPGEQIRMSSQGVEIRPTVDAAIAEQAFQIRRMVAQARPLSEVLEQLSRFRPGYMRFDREALSKIEVSAVLPLDDTDRSLQLLVDSFPQLRVRTLTPWLVMVDTQP